MHSTAKIHGEGEGFLKLSKNIAFRYANLLGRSMRRPQAGLNVVGKKFLFLLALKPKPRTALFWVITPRVVVISYRRFGTTIGSSWILEP